MDNVKDMAREYLAAGMALVPIPPTPEGTPAKGPTGAHAAGWNKREQCITDEAGLDRIGEGFNIGVAHAYSNTCCIDIDDLHQCAEWLQAAFDIDINEHINADDSVLIRSGVGNHAKLLYRLPEPLPQKKHKAGGQDIVDFRCETSKGLTVQDVLPGSIHPTGTIYEWDGNGDWREPPMIPDELLQVWHHLLSDTVSTQDVQPMPDAGVVALAHLNLSHDVLKMMYTGVHPNPDIADRSTAVWAVMKEMIKAGATDELIQMVINDPTLAISAKPQEKGAGARQWVQERINEARLRCAAEDNSDVKIVGVHIAAEPQGTVVDFPQAGSSAVSNEPAPKLLMGIAEILAKSIEPVGWLCKPYFYRPSLMMIYGPPKHFKSFLALDLALSLATGLPWLNRHEVQESGTVVYVAGEGTAGVTRRVAAWLKDRGADPSDLPVRFYQSRTAIHMLTPDEVTALKAEIDELVEETGDKVVAIFLDTLARNFGDGDESKTPDMNRFVSACDRELRDPFDAMVGIVHHTGVGDQARGRGSSALPAALDGQFRVKGKVEQIGFRPDWLKDAETPRGFVLKGEPVDLGLDADGEPINSLVLRVTEEAITTEDDMTDDQRILWDIIKDRAGMVSIKEARALWMEKAAELPAKKGKNKGQKRQKGALRNAWHLTLHLTLAHTSVSKEEDEAGNVQKLGLVRVLEPFDEDD